MNKFFDNEITCAAAVFLLGIDAFAILCAGFYSTFKVPMFAYCNMYMGTGISTEFTGVLMLSLFVLLAVIIRSVGHYRGNELAKNTVIDRIPIEIVYTVLGMAFFFFGWGVAEFSMQIYDMYVEAGFPRAVFGLIYRNNSRYTGKLHTGCGSVPGICPLFQCYVFFTDIYGNHHRAAIKDQNIPLHKPFVDYLRLVCKADNQMF